MSGTAVPALSPAMDVGAAESPSDAPVRGAPPALKLVQPDTIGLAVPAAPDDVRRHIVMTALRLAEAAGGWDPVHVHAVAREAGVTMEELHRHFPDKDCITEGFFDLADAAMTADLPHDLRPVDGGRLAGRRAHAPPVAARAGAGGARGRLARVLAVNALNLRTQQPQRLRRGRRRSQGTNEGASGS